MQVEPTKSLLKAPEAKRLKLKHDEFLSIFYFEFNLCRYTKEGYLKFLVESKVGCRTLCHCLLMCSGVRPTS
jgi:hypothetical protein